MSWAEQWVLASVDIELFSPAFKEAVQDTAKLLHQALLAEKPKLLEGQGWMLRLPLEANRMILLKRNNIIEKEFSAEWIIDTGKELFNQLSEIIPIVDKQLDYLFGE